MVLTIALSNIMNVMAQEQPADTNAQPATETQTEPEPAPAQEATPEVAPAQEAKGAQVIKEKFIEGDPTWMSPVLICLILGLAIALERIITLFLSTINVRKFEAEVEEKLKSGGVEAAKEVCRNTRGPIASIYYGALDRVDEGLDVVEKAIVSNGSVQSGKMSSGLVWISLFISLSPMLGFLGTVVGMIQAFDDIGKAGDISPQIVADGIKIALLTTVAGLIVAIILQIFYNLIVSKIDSMTNQAEESSINLLDMLIETKSVKSSF